MASRFIDTDIWKEDWFCDLGSEYQNFWNYITCHCNNAGIWKPNKIDFEIKTKTKINLSAFIDKVNEQGSKDRIIITDSGRWFLTGFIAFQWFNKQECFDLFLSNKLHKHIYELLSKDGILIERVRGLREVLERSNQTSKDKERGKECLGINKVKSKSKKDFGFKETVTKKDYEKILSEIPSGSDDLVYWDEIKKFIKENSPDFFEPYLDLWNIFAIRSKLIKQNQHITDERVRKFNTRIKEPDFDFLKILECIQRSEFAKGNNSTNWKVTIEFILHSQENYIKILEGKYE